MKLKLVFFLLLISAFHFGQQLDLKAIEKNIKNPKSPQNYEQILFKYLGYPASLDTIDVQHLYYGRNFIKDKVSFMDEDFKKLAVAFKDKDFKQSAILGDALFKKDPTNLDVMLILLQTYQANANEKDFVFRLRQLRALVGAIQSSGNGKTEKTPFIVNTVGDEYIFLNSQNFKLDGYSRSSKPLNDGMLDIWTKGNESIYVKILYLDF